MLVLGEGSIGLRARHRGKRNPLEGPGRAGNPRTLFGDGRPRTRCVAMALRSGPDSGRRVREVVVIADFDWERKEYEEIPLADQVEVLTLAGDVALKDGEPSVHAHVVLGKREATAHGGHLLEARGRPPPELVPVESPAHLRKEHDPESGLALVAPRT